MSLTRGWRIVTDPITVAMVRADGTQVHDVSTLLEDLSTLSRQTIRMTAAKTTFDKLTTPTPVQQHAFSLLGIPITL